LRAGCARSDTLTDRSGKEVVRVWYCYGIIMVLSQPGGSIYDPITSYPHPLIYPVIY